MLAAITTQFKGLLNRSFWFGAFLPVALIAFLHALIFGLAFPGSLSLQILFRLNAPDLVQQTAVIVLLLGIAAYLLSPLLPLFHDLADGSRLPPAVHDWLRMVRMDAWRGTKASLARGKAAKADADDLIRDFGERLPRARQAGEKKGITDPGAIEAAADAFGRLAARSWRKILHSPDDVRETGVKLEAALTANTAEWPTVGGTLPNATPATVGEAEAHARRLDALHGAFIELLDEIAADSATRFAALTERHDRFTVTGWQATRLGDVKAATERYSKDAYGADFGWLWPRLEALIGGDEKEPTGLNRRLQDTKSQLDFTVLLAFLLQTLPLLWLPILTLGGGDRWLIALVGAAPPIATLGLYEVLVRTQMNFGSIVETAIDRHRFELVDQLHQTRPRSLTAERELWRRLGNVNSAAHGAELHYEAKQ